jgi:hypothetical protein
MPPEEETIEKDEDVEEDDADDDLDEKEGDDDRDGLKREVESLRNIVRKERKLRQRAENRQLDDEDTAEFKRLKREERERRDKKLIDEGKVDELLDSRTAEMREAHRRELEERETKLTSMSQALDRRTVDAALTEATTKAKGFEADADDVLRYGKDVDSEGYRWMRDPETDREVFAREDDGHIEVKLGKDGKTPLTALEWLEGLRAVKRHWFGESKGAGGDHQNRSGAPSSSKKKADMDAAEKAAFIAENGLGEFEKLE